MPVRDLVVVLPEEGVDREGGGGIVPEETVGRSDGPGLQAGSA